MNWGGGVWEEQSCPLPPAFCLLTTDSYLLSPISYLLPTAS
ncbi:hypothetical protein N0824_00305 [Microcystis sp. 0824]|nr:hypothetical protein N0824_00305 [Microcystis sp. 0824]